uniref:Uncharacterized protein n=1 Tax=Aplanochytrium stocchinoi TaxID=215587 RepID=A0A7S3PSF2_9STRA|mmetsp:Transcript_3295/g.4178  ORF Transcript_3295/g.4178 Transcript_3295/m.4178 type:complete len:112 (+) Transcript_3295:97-432(+)|eukprot:CAMPEP_0204823078 /NCGR_PEP_ID=MMETSP1346-20131115/1223_1 /ASSEMBLY_ACC=CAM_ASM_000771 /TAXON_ID=215587 /ORGANISM="Aplanochytrium stocchinoi, Strain GSBS06" /LENGTH=111 /DNA_ID=CAMNT_0051949611 /DNA_START=187 /DNA_END=522 /DNA_ORIENTATION=+
MSGPARTLSRHVTADGRNSLKSHLFGARQEPIARTWAAKILKKETYPLIALMGGAVGLVGWFSMRHLTTSPDVQINKLQRSKTIRNNHKEGEAWVKSRDSLKNMASYGKAK